MDDQNVPIDIHSNKLLDWLVSRRHCKDDWQKQVIAIREKINHAIQDMPEHPKIVELLQGSYINYFHCQQIVEILKETEKDSKNFFGYYSSQRMKDWQAVLTSYEKDNIALAEAAHILQKLVQYEIPSLKKKITRNDQAINEAMRKETEYNKTAQFSKKAYEAELQKMQISGANIRAELMALATDLPTFFQDVQKQISTLSPAISYYRHFRNYVMEGAGAEEEKLLQLLEFTTSHSSDVTVFEWRQGKKPNGVERPLLKSDSDALEEEEDEIDFGDDADAEIDFGTDDIDFGDEVQIEIVGDESGVINDDIARGDDALCVFEFRETLNQLKSELNELQAFLTQRELEENADMGVYAHLASVLQRPSEIDSVSVTSISEWKKTALEVESLLSDTQKNHLIMIRASPQYVEKLVEALREKHSFEGKYKQLESLMVTKQHSERESAAKAQSELKVIVASTKVLKKQIEQAISKKYSNRPTHIMGEIAQALA
ncbi:hypothetical protein QR680_012610 [Steinernema hermaphroditum]|uniref:CDK5 regulatory subunit-associated protein 3 n=1 Tax=Steinernema hermaphroditum TaxID=289476 RepID=A0AA39I546_9BILA|nr:hypothetical protein QR680_012610 [Steinernema hermaphroditum]